MIELERSVEHRWTIDKNVNDKRILTEFATVMSRKNNFTLDDLIDDTISCGRFNESGAEYASGSSITVGVRLLQAKYYMLGYDVTDHSSGTKKFMPSPMLINCIENPDPVEQAKNFLVNLFSIQYPNPANRTPDCFNIYAGRLIVKLLLDNRIDKRLYIDECVWFLPFLERVDDAIYDELVKSIIEYRQLSYSEKIKLFQSVESYEYLFANVLHELNYYFLRLFQNMGVFDIIGDPSHNGGELFRFEHVEKTYRNDAYASRKKYSGYVILTDDVMSSAEKLSASFSVVDRPTTQYDDNIYNLRDWYTTLYEVEPLAYLNCINTQVDRKSKIQAIVSEMVRASKFGSHDGKEFESALKPFMELFKETLDVQIIAGAGNTDLLCTMEELPSQSIYKMNVDAKTRNTALSELNASRLSRHLRKHGAKFCMVVAPRFASGVKQDIHNSNIVVVKSEVLGSYCFHECTQSGRDYADFTSILNLINNNLGSDITQQVMNLTESRYAV